ncbi:MAG: indole-3-glycerol phosphate synthase TrpC [Anaerolineaceae bacterium]|nr:indole-3-glycerol phosphate synthase TrpC [Anaerolineaceae bacterium]
MSILDELANHARARTAADKAAVSPEEMAALASRVKSDGKAFYDAVSKPGMSFICEVKKASPSKGIIDPVFDYKSIGLEYEAAGADCISCLTEPKWFLGSDEIFREIRSLVRTPMIRKDFVVDEYQILQAKTMGADCVLLICTLLDTNTLARYLRLCSDLDLAALVETHDAEEISSAVSAGAKMIGVNNRNLKDFSVDFGNAARLRDLIPPDRLYVAESGVKSPSDAALLKEAGADAVLIGEMLMRAEDKKAMLADLREAAK